MFVALLGSEATEFGFSSDTSKRALVERQNSNPLPDTATILTFRLDDYNNWRSQRYGNGFVRYLPNGKAVISELRTFKCEINVMSKKLGDAFDATRFLLANLQNNRYNNFVSEEGRMLGIENIGTMKNLSDLENGTWTERINVVVQMNYKETIVLNDNTMFVKKPEDIGDLADSVGIETSIKK